MRYVHVLPPPHLSTSWTLPSSLVLWVCTPACQPHLSTGFHLLFIAQGNQIAIISLIYCKTKFSLSHGSFPLIHRQIVVFFFYLKCSDSASLTSYYLNYPLPFTGVVLKSFVFVFGATPIMFSSSALIEATLTWFTDNHNVDKACDYLNLTYQ